jgi:hypothetical protein
MDAPKRLSFSVDGWGRWVADPKAFLVVAPFWLVFSLLGVPNIGSPRVLLVAILANTVALSGCFGLLMLFRHTVFSRREYGSVRALTVVAVGAFIGAAKAVMTVSLIAMLIPDPSYFDALLSRVLAAALTGAWLLPVSAVFLATRERFLTEREHLLREVSSVTLTPTPDYSFGSEDTAKQVREFVNRARVKLENHHTSPAQLRLYLRKVFQPHLRRMTRQLVTDPATLMEGSSFRDLVAITIRTRSYPLGGVALVHIILIVPFGVLQVGLAETLGRALISTGLLVSSLWALKNLPTGGFVRGLTFLLVGLSSWVVANELLAFAIFGTFGDIPSWMTAFTNFTVALSHTVLLGAVRVATDQNKTIRSHLDNLVTEKYWQKDIGTLRSLRQRRALAQHLHGRLQSVLLATLTRLKKDPASTDCRDLMSELESLSAHLPDYEETSAAPGVTLSDGLSELSQRWDGILAIDWSTSEAISFVRPEDFRAVVDVVEESVSNAVRHGMATAVDISIAISGSHITVVVTDNGIGPRLGQPGVGSFLYSSLPGAQWSLNENSDQSGATLQVTWSSSEARTT